VLEIYEMEDERKRYRYMKQKGAMRWDPREGIEALYSAL
jgi:hypothetical protein